MPVRLNGSTSGYTEISAPAIANNQVYILPSDFVQRGNGLVGPIQGGSGVIGSNSVVPSWARRITVLFNNINFSGSAHGLIQLSKAGSYVTTGYSATSQFLQGGISSNQVNTTVGFPLFVGSTVNIISGTAVLTATTGNIWLMNANYVFDNNTTVMGYAAGRLNLNGTADSVSFISSNSTDTFLNSYTNVQFVFESL